ncbi:MAG: FAD-dependent oxidoreductase, partial [bacterium]|nr:FAD-dependent oxidoreductase [bacterium]
MKKNNYDLIIIGLGPAGLTASIYASRYKLRHVVIGKNLGGEMTLASSVENFPGFSAISGLELGQKMTKQAKTLGAEIVYGEIVGAEKIEGGGGSEGFRVRLGGGEERRYEGKTLIIASGTERRKLGVPGEMEFLGRGVSYCATCDATFFRGKTVAVIGGANAAVQAAVHLSEFADRVYIIYRGEALRAEPMWADRATGNPKVEVIYKTNIVRVVGKEGSKLKAQSSKIDTTKDKQTSNKTVQAVELDNPYHGNNLLSVDGVFIEAGGVPTTAIAKEMGVELTEAGFIKVNDDMSTSASGVFAAG